VAMRGSDKMAKLSEERPHIIRNYVGPCGVILYHVLANPVRKQGPVASPSQGLAF